jgi:hypothetical protein
MVTLAVDNGGSFLHFLSILVSPCSCTCASLHQMADKGRLSVEQCIKTVFFTETRSVVVTRRRFGVNFQMLCAPSFKTIHKFYSQFNNDGLVLERKCC